MKLRTKLAAILCLVVFSVIIHLGALFGLHLFAVGLTMGFIAALTFYLGMQYADYIPKLPNTLSD